MLGTVDDVLLSRDHFLEHAAGRHKQEIFRKERQERYRLQAGSDHRDGASLRPFRVLPRRDFKPFLHMGIQMVGSMASIHHDLRALLPCSELRSRYGA